MIKNFVIKYARRKNPNFTLDESVSAELLIPFIWDRFCAIVRGSRSIILGNTYKLLMLGANVNIKGWNYFSYGTGIQISNNVNINAYGKEGLTIGNHCWIGSFSVVKVSFSFHEAGSYIRIGNNVGIGEFAHLGGGGGLTIGNDCIIGPYFSCHPENHQFYNTSTLIRYQGVDRQGISIGNNCWIGAKVTILDGVKIGDNCIIAAGAVVNRDMPSNAVIAGVPAKVIRNRISKDEFNNTNSYRVA